MILIFFFLLLPVEKQHSIHVFDFYGIYWWLYRIYVFKNQIDESEKKESLWKIWKKVEEKKSEVVMMGFSEIESQTCKYDLLLPFSVSRALSILTIDKTIRKSTWVWQNGLSNKRELQYYHRSWTQRPFNRFRVRVQYYVYVSWY